MVDSVQVGTDHDGILHAISVATGGYRFAPKSSLGDALSNVRYLQVMKSFTVPSSPVQIHPALKAAMSTVKALLDVRTI